MKTGRFLKNAAILTVTALLLRTIGMFFRVWMANKIGSEGMGLYQLIFSVYVLVATFATTGICTAVTRIAADALENGSAVTVRRVMVRAITVTVIVGAISTALVYGFADIIAIYWIKDERAAESLRILSFSLIFMGISSCVRGYFVANRRVVTPSVVQIFEQIVRMAIIAVLIGSFCEKGLEYACAAVLIGDTVSEALSCLLLYAGYLHDRRKIGTKLGSKDIGGLTKKLLKIAVPISAGHYLTTLLRTVESLLVPDRLSMYNGSRKFSVSQYGDFKGMALPVLLFPSSFLSSLSTLLVPELSGANASGNTDEIKRSVSKCVGFTVNISMIIGGLFLVFGNDIGRAFYGSDNVGFYLRVLAPLVPLMYLESVTAGCLHGLNQQNRSLLYNVADSVVRISLIWILLPFMGMEGFMVVTVISNVLTSLLCLHRLLNVANVKFQWINWLIKPLLLTAGAVAADYALLCSFDFGNAILASIIEAAVGGGLYALLQVAMDNTLRVRIKSVRSGQLLGKRIIKKGG